MGPLVVSQVAARRFLLARTGLLAWSAVAGDGRPWRQDLSGADGTLTAIRRLEAVQLDPVNVLERNHHLVLYNRVGGYEARYLEELYDRKAVFEHIANARCVIPIEDLPILQVKMQAADDQSGTWRTELKVAVDYVKQRLAAEGPRPSRRLDTGGKVQGFWDLGTPSTKATSQALEHLWRVGEVVVAGRRGDERVFDLAENWLPAEGIARHPKGEAQQWEALLEKYVRAFGLFDSGDFRFGWRSWPVAQRRAAVEARVAEGEVVRVQISGVGRAYLVRAGDVPLLESLAGAEIEPQIFLLPPLDNVLWRRERVQDLFDFDYKWEIYVAESRRSFGPYAMPILEGDQLVGRMDARLDRAQGVLRVRRLILEPGVAPTKARAARVSREVQNLAAFVGAQTLEVQAVDPSGRPIDVD